MILLGSVLVELNPANSLVRSRSGWESVRLCRSFNLWLIDDDATGGRVVRNPFPCSQFQPE